jgi:ribonuclease J
MGMRTISIALPYLAEDLGVPIYATFTAGLIRGKLEEEGSAARRCVMEAGKAFEVGPFDFTFVPLALDPRGQCAVD